MSDIKLTAVGRKRRKEFYATLEKNEGIEIKKAFITNRRQGRKFVEGTSDVFIRVCNNQLNTSFLIDAGFNWTTTKEGREFWLQIYRKYALK